MPKTSSKQAKNLLQNVRDEWKAFWFSHGVIAHNLDELSNALSKISKENFTYHVNKKRNDLATWVNDVIVDKELAKKLKKVKTLSAAQKAVAARVTELQMMTKEVGKKAGRAVRPKALRVL